MPANRVPKELQTALQAVWRNPKYKKDAYRGFSKPDWSEVVALIAGHSCLSNEQLQVKWASSSKQTGVRIGEKGPSPELLRLRVIILNEEITAPESWAKEAAKELPVICLAWSTTDEQAKLVGIYARYSTPSLEELAGWFEARLAVPTGQSGALSETAAVTHLPEPWVSEVGELLSDNRGTHAVALFGPPGTGKTFVAQKIAQMLQPDPQRRRLVQLHPSYGYEDFFEGYRPATSSSGLQLELRRGPFREMAERAAASPSEPVVIILDEMNRGNLPRVFGELYFLLEYRNETTRLMYSPNEDFMLPPNLYLIGTMNTADRSIALLDQALRRRFQFIPMFPDEEPVGSVLEKYLKANKIQLDWLPALVRLANERIGDRNVLIGPSFFMRPDLDERLLERIWRTSVLPSVHEHFALDPERLRGLALDQLRTNLPA